MGIDVRLADGDDELIEATRVDAWAFAAPFDAEAVRRRLPWLRSVRTYMAVVDDEPVGTLGTIDFECSLPGSTSAPVAGVTNVGVLPTHRRRGVLTAMVRRALADSAAAGRVAATLYAAEAAIYGRYGFAPASRDRFVRVETRRAVLRDDLVTAPGGRLRTARPEEWAEVLPTVGAATWRNRASEVQRRAVDWDDIVRAEPPEQAEQRFCVVHETAGRPDGYAVWRTERRWSHEDSHHVASVVELVGATPAVELELWRAMFSLDLVRSVEAHVPVDTVLFDALVDPRAVTTQGEADQIWVCLLDVPAALAARRYRTALDEVIEVVGPAGSSTPVRLVVDDAGDAVAEHSDAAPTLRLGLAELGSLWFGGGSLVRLVALGRAEELVEGAASRLDVAAAWSPAPHAQHSY